MADYTRVTTGRASLILTTSEVAGNTLDLSAAHEGAVTLDFAFTKGSLTNVTLRLYASGDNGTTWKLIHFNGQKQEFVYTANTTAQIPVPHTPGCQKFRASVQGAGTATGSLAATYYRYLRRGSQG